MSIPDLAIEGDLQAVRALAGKAAGDKPACLAAWSDQPGRLAGIADVLALFRRANCPDIRICGRPDGTNYSAGEVVLSIEAPASLLIKLRSQVAALLSVSGTASLMHALAADAGPAELVEDFASASPPEVWPRLAVAAAIGGAVGTTARVGHAATLARFGIGGQRIRVGTNEEREYKLCPVVPHALASLHSGSIIEAAADFHPSCRDMPLIVPIDCEGRERDTATSAVRQFHTELHAVLLDIPAGHLHQGGHETTVRAMEMRILSSVADRLAAMKALDKYGFGAGVTIEAVYAIRDLLNTLGGRQTKIAVPIVDAEHLRALRACAAPVDIVFFRGPPPFAPFHAEMVRVQEDGTWVDRPRTRREQVLATLADLPPLTL